MTTPVAGAPAVSRDDVLGLVAWNAGHGWSRWHVELTDGRLACGHQMPDGARLARLSLQSMIGVLSCDFCSPCVALAVAA